MAYLVNDNRVEVIDADSVDIRNELPNGVYTVAWNKMIGHYFEKSDYNTKHGKIYGNAGKISNHIVESFLMRDTNLGVLLSGGKGLGKSLTVRLVVEQLIGRFPIIVINQFIPGMFDFLKCVSNAVLIFDEFEKTMQGHSDGSSRDTEAPSKQDEMLSLLDGTAIGSHNLYLLTCNETRSINENMKSRPGRIAYHYRYDKCGEEVIRNYCADHLQKKEYEDSIVEKLVATRYVSLDIIKAMVDEINNFDVTPSEALDYLNVETERIQLAIKVELDVDGKTVIRTAEYNNFSPAQKKISFYLESSAEEDKAGKTWYGDFFVNMEGLRIPYYGSVDVSQFTQICWEEDENYIQPIVRAVEVSDAENSTYTRYSRVNGYDDMPKSQRQNIMLQQM